MLMIFQKSSEKSALFSYNLKPPFDLCEAQTVFDTKGNCYGLMST